MATIVGSGEYRYEVIENFGQAATRLALRRSCRGRCGQQGQCLRVRPQRAPDDRVRSRRQLPALLGRGAVQTPARRAPRAGRYDLLHRRWRSHGAQDDAGRQDAAGDRHAGRAVAVHERRAVQPLHPHGAVARGRPVCVRRLRQRARSQIFAEWEAAVLLGRAGHRSGRVQHRAQHLLRRGRVGVCRGSREPSRAGVRRQGKIPRAVEQHASPLRAVHDARAQSARLCRRERAGDGGECEISRHRPARQHRDA